MGEWKEYKLGEVLTFQRGYDLPKSEMNGGDIPVAGSNGVIGYHNQYTTKGPGITIGRSGNIGIPKFYKDNFWAHNTVLYVKDFHGSDERFMYYFLQTVDFTQFNTGSAVPSLNRNHIHELRVFIPPLSEQKRIASILRSLDDKIDLLQRENKTLEAMAETLFRKWFIEDAKEEWEEKSLASVSDITAGGDKPKIFSKYITSECTIPVYSNGIDNEGLYGYTNIPKIYKESITVSARGTIGYVVLRRSPYVPIVRLISLIPKDNIVTAKWLYLYLKQLNINGTGTTQQQLTIPDFCSRTIILPPFKIIKKFTNIIDNLYDKQLVNKEEISCIEKMKNCLLKKLMHNK